MSQIVYSSEKGRICPTCKQPLSSCICKEKEKKRIHGSGKVRVERQTKGRGGKCVTVISELPLNEATLKEFSRKIKQMLSVGGSIKEGKIEIQGDHVEKIIAFLKKEGYSVKRKGG